MKVSSILVVNMNYLGDALMTTPAIKALKKSFEGARIDVLAGATAGYGALEILSMDADIDRLIPRVNGGSLARGSQLYRTIQSNGYDLVVILPSLPFYSAIARLTGRRVFTVPKADGTKHMADHMLDSVSEFVNAPTTSRAMVMQVPYQAEMYVTSLLARLTDQKKLVVFNVGASRPQKRWPSAHFAAAGQLVLTAGYGLVLVGGDNEQDLSAANIIMTSIDQDAHSHLSSAANLVGKTSLEQLSAVIKMASVIVTADTGAMHIACALDVPVVALFGSTNARFTGPYGERLLTRVLDLGLPCAPCITHPTCGGRFDCMTGILPEMVMQSILELMSVSEEIAACGIN